MLRTIPLLFAGLLATGGLFAQERPATPEPPAPVAQHQGGREAKPTAPRVSLQFAGGSLAEFVQLLRATDQRLNLVASAECGDVPLPAMAMTDASVLAALRAAAEMASSTHKVQVEPVSQDGGGLVIAITAQVRKPPATANVGPVRPRMAVFTLASLIEPTADGRAPYTADTVLSAIDAGSQGLPGARPQLRYHAESGLLFAYGEPELLDYVQQVLRELEQGAEVRAQRRGAADRAASRPKDGKDPK